MKFAWVASIVVAICSGADRCGAQVRVDVDAVAGTPFGVGRITVQSGRGDFRFNFPQRDGSARGRIGELARRIAGQMGKEPGINLDGTEMTLREKSDRIFYPVFEKRERPILREFVEVPTQTTIHFLFQGNAPLDLTVFTPETQSGQVVPRQDGAGYDRMLRAWWRDYSAAAASNVAREYPALVEEYLTDTLARRLRLPLPRRPLRRESSMLASELNALFETEAARLELAQTILLGDPLQPATERLPEELPAPKSESLNPPADVPIEPIALHVPVECFYVRFGSFPNFLWLRHRLEDWGGELRDIVSERGLSYGLNDRFQRQIGLRESALAEVLGERVIADVALIGTDMFLNEGAAIGMLFQAKNNVALGANLTQQRLQALKEEKSGKQEQVQIAGRAVSLISTPNNALRSFYVADGDFHLVTSSRAIVEAFLSVAAKRHDSLGASEEFRYTRTSMPIARNDTIFVYFSRSFFQNLLSPRYQIEIDRRLRSAVEMELFPIAQLAARGEQKPSASVADLVASGMLPPGFGQRVDGSRLELVDGQMVDSLRGGRGTFVPVPDVDIGQITKAEAAEFGEFSRTYSTEWGAMDPLVAAISRQSLPGGKLERVILDFEAAPLSQQHVQRLESWLGPPSEQRLAPIPGDVVAFEAVLRGGSFFSGGDHHLFGALRDADPAIATDPRMGLLARIFSSQLQGLQGYLGAWPNVGFLKFLGGASDLPSDSAGFTLLRTGLSRRQFDQFTLLSFHPEILELITPQLKFQQAERPAQIWIRAEDLAQSKLAPLLNAYGYRQSRQITLGNIRYMNMLSDQLHVPPADARATAERLLNAKFEAPLGGRYELREAPGGLKSWTATSLAEQTSNQPPADYQMPALNWLRGIQLEVRAQNGILAAHGEFVMPVEARPTFQMPSLQLPSLPFGAKPTAAASGAGNGASGGKKANGAKTPPKRPAPPAPSDVPAGKREF